MAAGKPGRSSLCGRGRGTGGACAGAPGSSAPCPTAGARGCPRAGVGTTAGSQPGGDLHAPSTSATSTNGKEKRTPTARSARDSPTSRGSGRGNRPTTTHRSGNHNGPLRPAFPQVRKMPGTAMRAVLSAMGRATGRIAPPSTLPSAVTDGVDRLPGVGLSAFRPAPRGIKVSPSEGLGKVARAGGMGSGIRCWMLRCSAIAPDDFGPLPVFTPPSPPM